METETLIVIYVMECDLYDSLCVAHEEVSVGHACRALFGPLNHL